MLHPLLLNLKCCLIDVVEFSIEQMHCLKDVSYETPDVTPCRTSPPMPLLRCICIRRAVTIHQRGVQWTQGVVIYMMLYTGFLYNSTPIHWTPLPLHPPVLNTHAGPERRRRQQSRQAAAGLGPGRGHPRGHGNRDRFIIDDPRIIRGALPRLWREPLYDIRNPRNHDPEYIDSWEIIGDKYYTRN